MRNQTLYSYKLFLPFTWESDEKNITLRLANVLHKEGFTSAYFKQLGRKVTVRITYET